MAGDSLLDLRRAGLFERAHELEDAAGERREDEAAKRGLGVDQAMEGGARHPDEGRARRTGVDPGGVGRVVQGGGQRQDAGAPWLDAVKRRLASRLGHVVDAQDAGGDQVDPVRAIAARQEGPSGRDFLHGERAELFAAGGREPRQEREVRLVEPGPHRPCIIPAGRRRDWPVTRSRPR